MRKEPLFSVVISCYNARPYISTVLGSLCQQGLRKDELEVIISDDKSTENYFDIVESFSKKLNIKIVEADHNWGYPAHTRQQGVEKATGEWIIFSDQDDAFAKNAFKKTKKYIKTNRPMHFIKGYVYLGFLSNKQLMSDMPYGSTNITHGVFFNRKNLWERFDIRYPYEEIKMEEDSEIMAEMACLEEKGLITVNISEVDTYYWYMNQDSIAHNITKKGEDRLSAEKVFHWYIRAIKYAADKWFAKGVVDLQYLIDDYVYLLIYTYVIVNRYEFNNKMNFLESLDTVYIEISKVLKFLYKCMIKQDLITLVYSKENIEAYNGVISDLTRLNDRLVEFQPFPMYTFPEFLDKVETYFNKEETKDEKNT